MEMLGAIQEMNCLICEADIKFPSPKRARIDSCGKETINKHEIQQCFEGNGELHDVIEKGKEDRNIANTELSSHEFIPPSRSHIFSDTEECSKITLDENENNPSCTKETNYQTMFSSLSTVGKNPNSFWNNQFLTSDLHGALEAKEGLHIITDNDKPKEVNIKEELEINKQCANNKAYITYQSYNENKITDVLNSIVDDLHTQNILNYTASDYTANVPKSSLESEEKNKDGKETKENYSADGNAKTLESVTENCMTNRIIPSQERKKTEMKNNEKITAVYATSEKANTKSILLVSSIDPHIERDSRAEAYYSFSSDNIGMETAECDVPFGIVLSQNIHVNETHEETKTRHDILSTYKEESDIHGAVCESQVECFKNSGSDVLGVIALEYVDYKENHIEKYKDEQVRSNVTELCKTKSDSRNKSGESHNYSASVQLEIESAVNNDARISGKIHFETHSVGLGSKIACGSTENCGIHEKELGIISLDHLSKLKIDQVLVCRHEKEKKEIHSGQQFINVALSQIQTEKMAVTKMDDMHNQSPSSNWKEEQYLNVNLAEQAAVSSKTMIEKENGVLLCGSSEMLPKNVKLHFQYKGDDSNHTTETESFLFINKNRQEISKPYPLQDFQDSCGIVYGKPHSGQSYQNITRMSTNYVEVHLSDESVNTWNADLNLNAQPLLHIKETQSEKLDVKLITENLLNRESDQSCSKLRHFLIQNRNGNDEEIELASQDVMHVNSTVNNQHENAIYILDCLPEDTSQRLLTFKCNEDVIDSDNLSGTHLYYSDTTFHEETVTTYRILKNAEQDVNEELMFDKDLDVRTNYSVMGPDAKDTKEKMYGSSQNGICEIDMVTPNYNYALISQIQEHNYIQKVVNTGKTEDEVLSPVSENSSRITGIVDDKQQSIACRTQSRFPPDIFTVPVFDTFEKIPLCLGNEEVENISLNNFPHNPATINTRKKRSLYSQTNATSSETHNNLLPVNVSKCKSKFDFSKQHSETGQISALEQSEDGYVNYSQKTGNGQTHNSMCSVCTKNFNTDEESSQNSPCQMPETETTEVLQTSEMDLDRSESMIQSVDSKATPSMYPLNLNVEMPKFEMKTQFDLVLEELSLFFEISKETEQPCSSTTTTETFFTQNLLFEKQESPCYVDCYSNSTFKHVSTLQNPGVSTVQPSEEMTQVRETTGEQEVPSHCSSSESEKEESLYSSFKNKDCKETGDKQDKQWSPAFLFCSLPHGKEHNVLGISGLHGSAGIVRLEPLKTCTGPIRLGLSKRVRPKQLHPYLK